MDTKIIDEKPERKVGERTEILRNVKWGKKEKFMQERCERRSSCEKNNTVILPEDIIIDVLTERKRGQR